MSGSRDWLLELGHTRLKLARLADGVAEPVGGGFAAEALEARLASADARAGDRCWLAAVPPPAITDAVLATLARARFTTSRVRTGEPALPVAPAYASLGVDRWLAMQAARARVPGAFCLVDVGTATTIDVVDGDGRHRGGWILPGPEAARAGLLARAPGLDRPPPADDDAGPASDTGSALARGLVLQQAGAVRQAAMEAAALPGVENPSLLLTGGGAGSLQSRLEEARVAPDLVLHGLAMAVLRLSE